MSWPMVSITAVERFANAMNFDDPGLVNTSQ